MKKMFNSLKRYRRGKVKMENTLAYLLAENQRQKERILKMEMQYEQGEVTAEDLACASALLQLRNPWDLKLINLTVMK